LEYVSLILEKKKMNLITLDEEGNPVYAPELMMIKEFKALQVDARPNSRPTKKGIDIVSKKLAIIFFMHDYRSPYFQKHKDEGERRSKILLALGIDPDDKTFKPDSSFLEAEKLYIEITSSHIYTRLVKGGIRAAYATEEYLSGVDYKEVDDNGKPIYKPIEVVRVLKELSETISGLEKLHQQAAKQQYNTNNEINKSLNHREDPRAL
jgi:hypothetical protein